MSNYDSDNIGVRTDLLESNHIAARFPTYFEEPTIWFAQIEAVFRISGITRDSTKFAHLLSNLPASVLMDFQDMVTSTSTTAYEDLKQSIIRRSSKSSDFHVQQLFNIQKTESASMTLSKLRRHLKAINARSDPETDPFLRTAFLNTLSIETRRHLILQNDQSLTHLATLADRLESLRTDGVINQIAQASPTSEAISSEIDGMRQTIVDLRNEINAIKRSNQPSTKSSEFCYYHKRFGSKAIKCLQPCNWSQAGKANESH